MGMKIGTSHEADEPDVMIDMNTTPLIDVMLVLLVMLIITIPIQLHSVDIALPVGKPPVNLVVPDKIQIDIDADSLLYWQGALMSAEQLESKLGEIKQQATPPDVHIRPHKNAQYAVFARVLASTKRQGLTKVAVIGGEQFVP